MNTSWKTTKATFKELMCILSLIFLFMGGSVCVLASPTGSPNPSELQQSAKKVEGVVKDNTGEPLIGVSVVVKGTTTGTVTDVDGKYSLNLPTENATIVFSYVGYKPQTIVANKPDINVVLLEDSQMMSEVVVVGYGVQKKENLTGAVSSVNVGETLGSRPIADAGRGLQGAVPGLTITLPSGEVGSDPTFRIRGAIGSISGSANPLILLDNVEIPSIQLVNPDDIESISVLKDAASTSIYGSKAAFGVILITTKRGAKSESLSISYSNNFAWQAPAKKIEMAGIDGVEYSLVARQRLSLNDNGGFGFRANNESLERSRRWLDLYGSSVNYDDPVVYGRDWYYDGTMRYGVRIYDPYKAMIKEWAPTQTHNLSLNGKSGKTSYSLGLGLLDQSGMFKQAVADDFKRYNVSMNVSTEINKYVSIRGGFLYSDREKRSPASASSTSDPWYYLYRWSSLMPVGVEEDGVPLKEPVAWGRDTRVSSRRNIYTNVNLGATVNIKSNWDFKFDYTLTNNNAINSYSLVEFTGRDSWFTTVAPVKLLDANNKPYYVDNDGRVVDAPTDTNGATLAHRMGDHTYGPPGGAGTSRSQIYRRSELRQESVINTYSTYNLKLGAADEHVFKFMLGMNRVTATTNFNMSQKESLADYNNPQFSLAYGNQYTDGYKSWEGQLGFFGRVNYALKDRYLLEANLRRDGSSKFPNHLWWRWFPSFSGGWIVSNEKFMENTNKFLDFAKLRASWGTVGDQSVPNNLYVATMPLKTKTYWLTGGNEAPSVTTPPLVAPDITWQNIENTNLGIDLRFLKSRLGVSFDWFQRYTRDMIIDGTALPFTAGVVAPKVNDGELRTRGWEISVNYNHRFNNGLVLTAQATLADAITDITKYTDGNLPWGNRKVDSQYSQGKRYGDIWGYRTDRLYQADDFVWDKVIDPVTNKEKQVLRVIEVADRNGTLRKMYQLKGDNPTYQTDLQGGNTVFFGPGDVKYKDVNGDGRIYSGDGTNGDPGDREVIGNSTPRFEYGFRLGAEYKGFDLSMFFQGIGSRQIWGVGPLAVPGFNVTDGAMPQTIAGDFWKPDRTDAFYPNPYNLGGTNPELSTGFNMVPQDRYLLNMAYLRLKNLTFGYSVPTKTLKKIYMNTARVYVSFENLLTFDHLRGLPIDPEVVSGVSMFNTDINNNNYNAGRTGVGAPMFKTASVGVQLTF